MNLKKKPELFGAGPVLAVPDISATVDYYCDVLGFDRDFVMGDPPSHGSVTRCRVGIQFTSAPSGFQPSDYPGWNYFFLDGIDGLYSEYREKGVVFTREIESHGHGMREFEVRDCNGYRLRFGQYLQSA